MASRKRSNWKAFSRSITPIRFIGILVLVLSLPVTVYLVRNFVLNRSYAAGQTDVYFDPASRTLPPDGILRVMTYVGTDSLTFGRVEINFDNTLVELTGEIIPTGTLKNVIGITSRSVANSTGKAQIVLGLKPGDVPPSGHIVFATIPIRAKTTASTTTSFTINAGASQLVSSSGTVLPFTTGISTLTLNPRITPTANPTSIVPTPIVNPNLLLNGSFETDTNNDGSPDNWTVNTSAKRSSALKYKGSYSLLHNPTVDSDYKVKQNIPNITTGSTYTFSGRINIPPVTDSSFQFKVNVDWLDSNKNQLRSDTIRTFTKQTSGWEELSQKFTSPANTSSVEIRMTTYNLKTKIYADDFSFNKH